MVASTGEGDILVGGDLVVMGLGEEGEEKYWEEEEGEDGRE